MAMRTVKKYYSELDVKEWKRLVRDAYHRLEFDTTMHFFKKHSPPEGLVLDAGGGPGRYVIELAKFGYDVVLLDLTWKNWRELHLKTCIHPSVVDISQHFMIICKK